MPATEVLVFMLINLKGKWKCPIGYFFQNKINAVTQAELIKSALSIKLQLNRAASLALWPSTRLIRSPRALMVSLSVRWELVAHFWDSR
ncbi:hypothetical protein OFM39_28110, partial [Escherichia coli]|nr:hypothetical protein [Escherichia coli]